MVSIAYSHRIVCDTAFIKWLLQQAEKKDLFRFLMFIKSSSQDWKKCHNTILKSEYELNGDEIDLENKENAVGSAFKISTDPNFLNNYAEQISKNIVWAIEMTGDTPYRCYIFTSPEKEQVYKSNHHFNGITSVEIVSGDKAKKIIKEFFQAFKIQRDIRL